MSEHTPGDADALGLPELLRPAIEDGADEAEALGQLPEGLVKELREAGADGDHLAR